MKKRDDRAFMEMAIEVMRNSVDEPRTDGKASPKVGAVLVRVDGSYVTSCRGELRHGDHAEFTVLERKLNSEDLTGTTLFATLEPCAPGCRQHPKLGCAERIVLARISKVWVGIEDPDPTVDRKGIKYLQDSGIDVRMFDRDFQDVIRAENVNFIEQALERAAAASEKLPPEIVLSPLEKPDNSFEIADFSTDALETFRSSSQISGDTGSSAFNRRLSQMGILKQDKGKFTPTGFGLLLFGKSPRDSMPQAGLLGTIHYPNGKEEVRDFDGPQVLVPQLAIQWLKDKLPNLIDRRDARRRFDDEPLFEMVREGIVNALVHRDYGIEGAKCQLVVTPDTIEIRSPGTPVDPITLEQLQSFNAPMLSRNPALHYVFGKMELAEERGLGLKSMRSRAEDADLPRPTYAWKNPYLVLTLFRSRDSAIRTLNPNVQQLLSDDESACLEVVSRRHPVSSSEVVMELGLDERKVRRILKKLTNLGLIRRFGKGPGTKYEVVPD